MNLSDKLRNINIKGFHSINWDIVFKRLQIEYECGLKNSFFTLLSLPLKAFISRSPIVSFNKHDDAKILSYINQERISCHLQNENVTKLVKMDVLSNYGKTKLKIHSDGYELIFLFVVWFVELRKRRIPYRIIGVLISYLMSLWRFQKFLNTNVEYRKYNLLLTFYDSPIDSAFITELFRSNKVRTATLQHGQFTAWRENDFVNSGVEFRSFSSDYMLCWNKFTVEEAVKTGIKKRRMKIVGILGYVNAQTAICTNPQNGIFGVVIGHPMFEQQNVALITAANMLAQTYNLKYYLKLHPNYTEDYYKGIVEPDLYLGNVEKGIGLLEYANSVEFSLVGSSSIFVELIYVHHDVIRFSDNDVKDKFRDIRIGKRFSNPEELVDIYKKNVDSEYFRKLFDYLCTVENVTETYKDFLKTFS